MDDKTELFAERDQITDLPDSFMSKGKMLSDKDFFESEPFGQHLLGEHLRREGGKCVSELQGDHVIDPRLLETSTFLFRARQES